MYFANFPLIIYDSVGNGKYKIVTNLLKRVALRSKVKSNTLNHMGDGNMNTIIIPPIK